MDGVRFFFVLYSYIIRDIYGTQVHHCPVGLREWKERQHTLKCDTRSGRFYTCVKSTLGHFWEQCSYEVWIKAGKKLGN